MIEVNVHEAKTQLSRLLKKVEQGEEVVIARAGEPIAKLVRIAPPARIRRLGQYAGQLRIADDFDAPLDPETFEPER
ncbi:MAG TPA: type II toxin-antitoxin system prevent-host-death family antitoxin [Thermoanaerobaculia bacterium]|nr:type II toxin-antitoxin system prevent-host-death family antitoxin [Thermoanaerobaculia bacterium]